MMRRAGAHLAAMTRPFCHLRTRAEAAGNQVATPRQLRPRPRPAYHRLRKAPRRLGCFAYEESADDSTIRAYDFEGAPMPCHAVSSGEQRRFRLNTLTSPTAAA